MTEPSVWFAHAGGEQHGPLSRRELVAMAADGRLAPEDLVWESGTPEWVKAADAISFITVRPEPGAPLPPPPPRAPALPSGPRPGASARAPFREPPLRRFVRDLGALEPSEILPLRRLGEPELLGVPAAWVLLFFGLAPLAVAWLVEDPDLRVRLFRIGFGLAWCAFLVAAFRSPRARGAAGLALFGTGVLLGALLLSVLPGVPPLSWLLRLAEPARAFPLRLLGFFLAAGLASEGAKLLALLGVARLLGGVEDAREGAFSGLLVGAGFGLWEAAAGSEWAGARHGGFFSLVTSPSAGLEALFVSGLARAFALPALEAAWGAVLGTAAALAASRRAPAAVLPALFLAALLHGAFATFRAADQGAGALLVAALSLLLMLATLRSAEDAR